MGGHPSEPSLIDELRWLERLAVQLVRDPEEARDLSQAAALVALDSGGPAKSQRRPWLAGILRNLAAKGARARGRRIGIERRGARSEALPSTAELAERTDTQSRLLELVQALPEHYRDVLLLRYYDGASVAEIAIRFGCPERTVHTRLYRARALLRERMDAATEGGREAWLRGLALAPLSAEAGSASLSMGAALPLGLASGAVLLASLAWIARATLDRELGVEGRPSTDPTAFGEGRSLRDVEPIASRSARTPVATPPVGAAGVAAGRGAEPLLARVIDWRGEPVGGALVEVSPLEGVQFTVEAGTPDETIEGPSRRLDRPTAADGSVELPRGEDDLIARASVPGTVCAAAGIWRADRSAGESPTIVVAPAMPLERRVVDARGGPVVDLRAIVTLPASAQARFDAAPTQLRFEHWQAITDVEGRFAFDAVPQVAGARLTLARPDLGRQSFDLADLSEPLVFELDAAGTLAGRVVDLSGAPIDDALVCAGGRWTHSDGDGRFSVAVPAGSRPESLGIGAAGWAPLVRELSNENLRAGDLGTIVVDGPAQAIAGVVVDPRGEPLAGLLVWLDDPTLVPGGSLTRSLEAAAGEVHGLWHAARTAADGSFELGGLRGDRTYRLVVGSEATALTQRTEPLAAGRVHRVRFEDRASLNPLEGRIVTPSGQPVAGVDVVVQAAGFGYGDSFAYLHGAAATTDRDGRFELDGVPTERAWLRAFHPDHLRQTSPVTDRRTATTWVLPLRASLSVQWVDLEGSEEIWLEDEEGGVLTVHLVQGLGTREVERVDLVGGAAPLLQVPAQASVLVAARDGDVVLRMPLRLRAGEVHRLRL